MNLEGEISSKSAGGDGMGLSQVQHSSSSWLVQIRFYFFSPPRSFRIMEWFKLEKPSQTIESNLAPHPQGF